MNAELPALQVSAAAIFAAKKSVIGGLIEADLIA